MVEEKIPFWPQPFFDELFYGICSRFSDRADFPTPRDVNECLFGKRKIDSKFVFPNKLNTFFSRLPPTIKLTIDDFIDQHTLLPYYLFFAGRNRGLKIRENMKGEDQLDVYRHTGLSGSNVNTIRILRYCPKCIISDKFEFGESYWHRNHQLPGVHICVKHLVWLKPCEITERNSISKYIYFSTERVAKDVGSQELFLNNEENIFLLHIAKISSDILSLNKIMEPTEIQKLYYTELAYKGLLSPQGRINMVDLEERFRDFASSRLIYLTQRDFTWSNNYEFLQRVLSQRSASIHPLSNIIFLAFLQIDVSTLSSLREMPRPEEVIDSDASLLDKAYYREQWKKLIPLISKIGLGMVKRIYPTLHLWLSKFDKEWLENNTTKKKAVIKNTHDMDWDARDYEILKKIQIAHARLINKPGRPSEITKIALAKEIGDFRWLGWISRKKLPKTINLLDQILDTSYTLAIRRIEWGYSYFRARKERPSFHGFVRFSGINTKTCDQYLIEEINKKLKLLEHIKSRE